MNPGDQGFKIVLKTVGGALRTFLRLTGIHIICSLNAHPRVERDSKEYSPSCFNVGENHLPSYAVQRTPMLPETKRERGRLYKLR